MLKREKETGMKSNREGNFLGKTSRLPGNIRFKRQLFCPLKAREMLVLGERMIFKPRQAVSGKGERKMQSFQYIASVILLAVFILSVLTRSVLLRRRGIRAIVFGATDKTDFLLVPFVLAVIYAVLANSLGLPLWKPLVGLFWATVIPGWAGLVLSAAAALGMIGSLISFGDSFRVGIDEKKPGGLVTAGMFGISRNPVYVCFDAFFVGMFLIHRNIVILAAVIAFALLIHRQILREEKFLRSHYGSEYEEYCRKVRRYL